MYHGQVGHIIHCEYVHIVWETDANSYSRGKLVADCSATDCHPVPASTLTSIQAVPRCVVLLVHVMEVCLTRGNGGRNLQTNEILQEKYC